MRIVTAVALAYSIVHFALSGVRYPLTDPNLAKFDEQLPALVEHLRTGAPVSIHNPVQYGPVFFFVAHPLLLAADGSRTTFAALLYALQLACAAGAFALTCATLRRRVWSASGPSWPLTVSWLAVLWLNFAPLYSTIAVKSVETWELFFVSLALWAHVSERPWLAAFAIAVSGLVKLLPLAFIYYWLLTDRRMFARACAAVLVLLLVGHALYGPEMGLAYLAGRTGGTFGFSYGMTWHENVSLKAAIAKLLGHLAPAGYQVDLTPLQLTATILIGDAAIVAIGVWLSRYLLRTTAARTPARIVWEWSFFTVATLILSPNTTLEYATLALGACSYALVRLADDARRPRAAGIAFGGALLWLGGLLPRRLLHRVAFVETLNAMTGNTQLTPPEAYQYYCFPLLGLALLALTLWRLR